MSTTKKVSIKPLREQQLPQEVLDVLKRAKGEPVEKILRRVGSEGFNNAMVQTVDGRMIQGVAFLHNEKVIVGVAPQPVDLYFGIAYTFMLIADQQLRKLDQIPPEEGKGFAMCWDNTFNAFLQYRISFVMLSHATLETFINGIVPDGEYRYKRTRKVKGVETEEFLVKEEIERLDFSEKLRKVVPSATGIDVAQTNSKLFKRILELNDIRRDVTHLRSVDNGKPVNYITVYARLAMINMRDLLDAVREYVNLIKPDTIQFTGD